MARSKGKQGFGEWAFFGGVLLAIIFGAFPAYDWVSLVLVILGLLVGFLNVTDKETTRFVIAGIALLLVQTAGVNSLPLVGDFLKAMLSNIAIFVAPAILVVALKEVYDLAVKK